jgi:threonylcarbamoyladenosine tRNA methylthiotransferase MtaB
MDTSKPGFLIQTLGCKVNQYDSERIRTQLVKQGYRPVTDTDDNDPQLIVINTCSVTSESDRKGRQLIRKLIRKYPQARVAITGCYSERKPHELLEIDGVDEIVPIESQDQWVEHIAEEMGWGCEDQNALWDSSNGIEQFAEHTRAFVKIQDGCDLKCTFCSIPDSRGKSRSRPKEEILAECNRLVNEIGFPEIVLCGICIGHYGRDTNTHLHDLVKEIALLPKLKRIRISSLEPQDLTEDLLYVMAEHQSVVCPHLHLPLQSGSNRILRRMKRPHSVEYFFESIDQARSLMKNFEVSTDLMVGFPGETEDDFQQTIQAVERSRFNKVHSFRFSARDDTPAMKMKEHLHSSTIEERRKILDQIATETANKVKMSYIGTIQPVLVELEEEENNTGFTSNYIRVNFETNQSAMRGTILPVKITGLENGRLKGMSYST